MARLPDLDQLAAAVVTEAGSPEPLDQLAAAARTRDELDELSDALLDRFVEQARAAGSSWSQIGRALGVSKQAAQQRHTANDSVARRLLGGVPARDLSRLTPRARSCIAQAQSAAQRLGHNYIGTEHLLLGLFGEPDAIAARVLAEFGVTESSITSEVKADIGVGPRISDGEPPMTPRARKVLQSTLQEALALGHNYVGTEHILLALFAVSDGLAARLLRERRVDHTSARDAVVRLLTGQTRSAR